MNLIKIIIQISGSVIEESVIDEHQTGMDIPLNNEEKAEVVQASESLSSLTGPEKDKSKVVPVSDAIDKVFGSLPATNSLKVNQTFGNTGAQNIASAVHSYEKFNNDGIKGIHLLIFQIVTHIVNVESLAITAIKSLEYT